jgi:hypothetical protein
MIGVTGKIAIHDAQHPALRGEPLPKLRPILSSIITYTTITQHARRTQFLMITYHASPCL